MIVIQPSPPPVQTALIDLQAKVSQWWLLYFNELARRAAEVRFVDRGDPSVVDKALAGFTVDSAWHDWDLSQIVPPGAVAVLLRLDAAHGGAGTEVAFRKNGQTNTVNRAKALTQVASVTISADLVVACDADRLIEYYVQNVGTWSILNATVAGWWI